jgi:hypothetical protein
LKEESMKRSPFPGAVSLGAALALLAPVAARAQTPGGQYFVVHQEVAKPSMIKEYESTSKEFVAPIPNMVGMDAINADFGALAQAVGASFADLNKRGGTATEYIKEWVIQLVPELSYSPAEPRAQAGPPRYFHYDIYYVMPGRDPEAESVGAEYVKLFKAKAVKNAYNVYKVVMGAEMPAYIVSVGAADAAAYHADSANVSALLGTDLQALSARTAALTRRFETREATARPDLSVPR